MTEMQMQPALMGAEPNVERDGSVIASRRLIYAAHEFEGQMLKELLKPMTETDGLGGSDSGSGILAEFGSEALGRALSEQGGFGIAKQILAQLSQSGNGPESELVTGGEHRNTALRALK